VGFFIELKRFSYCRGWASVNRIKQWLLQLGCLLRALLAALDGTSRPIAMTNSINAEFALSASRNMYCSQNRQPLPKEYGALPFSFRICFCKKDPVALKIVLETVV